MESVRLTVQGRQNYEHALYGMGNCSANFSGVTPVTLTYLPHSIMNLGPWNRGHKSLIIKLLFLESRKIFRASIKFFLSFWDLNFSRSQ
jgi:hypothetical protein